MVRFEKSPTLMMIIAFFTVSVKICLIVPYLHEPVLKPASSDNLLSQGNIMTYKPLN